MEAGTKFPAGGGPVGLILQRYGVPARRAILAVAPPGRLEKRNPENTLATITNSSGVSLHPLDTLPFFVDSQPVDKITKLEILRGKPEEELSLTNKENLNALHKALNLFRNAVGIPMVVTSGYRSYEYNKRIGGSENSAHISCEACDFADVDKKLASFMVSHLEEMYEWGLHAENPFVTTNWLHLTTRPPNSGRIVFNP